MSHRVHRWLAECLQSVDGECDELLVVDNGSPGGAVSDVARQHGARTVRLFANAGFPAGVNAGVEQVRGDVVALLNDDAMSEPGWLASARDALGDPTIAAVCPKLLWAWPHAEVNYGDEPRSVPGDTRPLGRALLTAEVGGTDVLGRLTGTGIHDLEEGDWEGRPARWRWTVGDEPFYAPVPPGSGPGDLLINGEPAPVSRVVDVINNAGSYLSQIGHVGDYGYGAPDDGRFDEAADRFAACGAAVAFRAETWRKVGPFAADFFAYYEDGDWCWRAQLAGLRIRYEPAGVVRHVGSVSTGGPWQERVRFLAARNRLLCLARNAPVAVATEQVRSAWRDGRPPGLRRALASRLPRAAGQRLLLSRSWQRSPRDVWSRWSGVGETW